MIEIVEPCLKPKRDLSEYIKYLENRIKNNPEYQRRAQEIEKREKELAERMNVQQAEEKSRELQRRGLCKRYLNASWENWIEDTTDKQLVKAYAQKAWEKNMFFTGANGTGKTYLAMCLVKDGAMYRRLSDIFREFRLDFENEAEKLDFYGNRKLLIIDEVGREKGSEFTFNLFFEIIDRRWNNVLPTTLITNLSMIEFAEMYGNGIIDRLRPQVITFDWNSGRK